MAEHVDTIAALGALHFATDKTFREQPNRRARAAAWRMIREQEGPGDDVA